MRQWVKAEVKRLRRLLQSYKFRELSDADIRVILRGKALEFYSRHYGKVYTAADSELSIRDALLGINQLLDEDTDDPGERPPSVLQPICYQFLRLFGEKAFCRAMTWARTCEARGWRVASFVDRGWVEERGKGSPPRADQGAVREDPSASPQGDENRDRPSSLPDRGGAA